MGGKRRRETGEKKTVGPADDLLNPAESPIFLFF